MLHSITKKERKERTIDGVLSQLENFTFIIEEYIEKLDEKEMMGLWELREDLDYI